MFVIMGGYFQLFSFHVLFLFVYVIVKKTEKFLFLEKIINPLRLYSHHIFAPVILFSTINNCCCISAYITN